MISECIDCFTKERKVIHVIILAGGNSSRFKSNKLLCEVCGRPLFSYSIENLRSYNDISITVVTQYPEILRYCKNNKIACAFENDCKRGISYSIKAGLDMLTCKDPEEVVFMSADQPLIKAQTIKSFYEAYKQSEKGIASLFVCGQPSNPAIFSKKYFESLKMLEGDHGGREIINENIQDCFFYEIEDFKQIMDVDTESQMESIAALLSNEFQDNNND